MMHFSFHPVETLPKLAWCAVLHRGEELVQVFHGPWVETRDRFFVDGIWDGPFEKGGLDTSGLLMGSGAKIIGDKVLFATPCHTLEKLHLYKTEELAYVSSSMVFLLASAHRRLDMNYIRYELDLLDQMQGLKYHVGHIPLDNGDEMLLCRYRNVEIGPDLEFRIHPKPKSPSFSDFADYKAFLIDGLSRLTENARDPARAIHYRPLTTVSTGYDSAACSALATEIGCTEAVTVVSAREQYGFAHDSGRRLGELMGLRVREYAQDAYKSLPGLPEAEFTAVGDAGPDVVFSPMEDVFRQRFVITGIHGDTMWERQNDNVIACDIVRHDLHGSTMSEFRTRVGFVHVPVPFIGCFDYPSIHKISNSEEMAPWCVGGRYDRPIARRLVEEMGAERNAFGMRKLAVTVCAGGLLRTMEKQMSPQSRESFRRFYAENKKNRSTLKHVWHCCMFLGHHLWAVAQKKLGVLPASFSCPIPRRFDCNPLQRSFMLHWGISVIEKRFEVEGQSGLPSQPRHGPAPLRCAHASRNGCSRSSERGAHVGRHTQE
jgi:hypothetical protein